EQFKAPRDIQMGTGDPIMKAAMVYLAEVWPRAISFNELRKTARSRLTPGQGEDPGTVNRDTDVLASDLLKCYVGRVVEVRSRPLPITENVTGRPKARPLARQQAERGAWATNLRHEAVALNDFNRQVLRHLDGTRDSDAMLKVLKDLCASNVLVVRENGNP